MARPCSSGTRRSTPSEVNHAGETRVRKLLLVSRDREVDAVMVAPLANRREKLAALDTLRVVGASSPGGAPERIEMTGNFWSRYRVSPRTTGSKADWARAMPSRLWVTLSRS